MAAQTLLALEGATQIFGTRALLDDVSVGVIEGSRIGVVGRNGGGKSTLLKAITASAPLDSGRAVRATGVTVGMLSQDDPHMPNATLRDLVLGDRDDHEWAGDARIRSVVEGLLGGLDAPSYSSGFETPVATMSGGERRRASLARLLLDEADVLVLDEPTNHLDVEAIAWLARHLAARRGTLLVVTHDRWFLDEVCTETWEVVDGAVHRYDGGYAAFVLARAERARVAAVTEDRRQNLLRKELAWLRRGAPARTSKPKFRIDAANELIADEPPPRDRLELQKFSTARLGRQVFDFEHLTLRAGGRGSSGPIVLTDQTIRLGPGDRIGVLGPNGAGKSTLLSLMLAARGLVGEESDQVRAAAGVESGEIEVGRTVAVVRLSQNVVDEDPEDRVLSSVERIKPEIEVGKGKTMTARSLLESFGFSGDRLMTRLGDLSGGERRRLALLRLLLDGPNVLLLDEPTNDLDIETLTVLEDLLDSWPGTLVAVSHDRYFLERVTDDVHALLGDGKLRHLPGGVDEYLKRRAAGVGSSDERDSTVTESEDAVEAPVRPKLSGGEAHAARKDLGRIDRRMAKLRERQDTLHDDLAKASETGDYARVGELDTELRAVSDELDSLEYEWLEIAEKLEA